MGTDPTPPMPLPCFPQSAALECSFGQEEIFEAVWVNESAVRCNQVVVSGVAAEGAGEDLHKSRYCTAFFPSSLFPPFGSRIPSSPVLICHHDIPSPAETWTPSTPLILFPVLFAATHDPEEPGVSTQRTTKRAVSQIPGQP